MTPLLVLREAATGAWLRFSSPLAVISAHHIKDVLPALRTIEARVNAEGLWAAGFVSYDAAPAFDSSLAARRGDVPLVWFGLFDAPHDVGKPADPGAMPSLTWTPNLSRTDYDAAIAAIRSHIADGDTYQVNFTFRLRAPATVAPWSAFCALAHAQHAPYVAFAETGAHALCAASPELFFSLDGRTLTSRPMKGTAPRGRYPAEDAARAEWLRASGKNRAENVMIVDMIRNDIGRVADVGSVVTRDLFQIERYPTVWQMTSTVSGETDASVTDIMQALFPCASITGAPKARTCEIIAALETTPRGLYTGAIGFIAPHRRAQFNVAIRTIVIDRAAETAEFGVGGGVTWESNAEDEYAECLTKARVLAEPAPAFELLETLRWTPAGFADAAGHLDRMRASANYFGLPFDPAAVSDALQSFAATLPSADHIVRLLLSHAGVARCEARPFVQRPVPVRLALAGDPIDSRDVFLFHKTTHRRVYDAARRRCHDADDVLLWNERDEITECSISNVLVQIDDALYTPPLDCGLLAGVWRARAIASGRVCERVITVAELRRAQSLWVMNSVRGEEPAVLVPGPYDMRVGAPS